MSTLCVIDFETTGLMPKAGGRPTEVAIVRLENGLVTGRFQSLMYTGVPIPPFVEQLTGISNAMLLDAPTAAHAMAAASAFVGTDPMVAHNASFDRSFWQSELAALDLDGNHPFACTVLLARRLYPQAPNHRLGTLVDWHSLPRTGKAHRALADAEMTAALLARMQHDLHTHWGISHIDHPLLQAIQRCGKAKLPALLQTAAHDCHHSHNVAP
jgi:DNA polymerase III subunit epsilon